MHSKNAHAPRTVVDLSDMGICIHVVGVVGADGFGASLIQIIKTDGVIVTSIRAMLCKSTWVGAVIV